MLKRISSRAIIIEGNSLYTIFRKKIKDDGSIKEYYVLPGGGKEANETLEENVIREIKEEFSVAAKIKKYLGKIETNDKIEHYFSCEIISGSPTLSGEELERCTEANYYEIRKVLIDDLEKIDISAPTMIMKAYNEEDEDLLVS